ncbi:Flagellar L-ring protein precursor [gamma proteobacterium HdN1]|nr:Flagellar L-ring protein precursor [gamma proteobacterium HdN1]
MNDLLNMLGLVSLFFAVAILSGCASQMPKPDDPRYAPVFPQAPQTDISNTGSIYGNSMGVSLYEDQRARRVGDILTVMLQERTSSSKTSGTDMSKDDSNNMQVNSILGLTPKTNLPLGLSKSDLSLNSDTDSKRKFKGAAKSDQSNQLQGNITVTVTQVMPNGILYVRGEKWITLAEGDEYIRIHGLVRTADINPDNTVQSSKIADARIAYGATGDFADVNQKGWLSRFFSSKMWPL